jgi:hypothetical protein
MKMSGERVKIVMEKGDEKEFPSSIFSFSILWPH